MKKIERDNYIFNKKCLLIILYLFYINNVDYKDITLRSFGFHFDPTCNFKVIVNSKNFIPEASLNIYFDESNFIAKGYIEGKYFEYQLIQKQNEFFKDEILYYLSNDKSNFNINESADNFILYLLRLYTYKIKTDLVMGAGINCDYGAKDWRHLIAALNEQFYKND